jgi:AcrR family transcriptional regulator
MAAQVRRARERAERHQLILATARSVAEREGWAAVTTRRLADEIEYSQPVLYSHFAGKDAIVAAVAAEGFGELADRLRRAAEESAAGDAPAAASGRSGAVAATVRAYVDFASQHPALYDAMFTLAVDLPFGDPQSPAPLRAAFDALRDVVAGSRTPEEADLLAEVTWSAVHGLVTLTRSRRLPEARAEERLALLIDHLTQLAADRPGG